MPSYNSYKRQMSVLDNDDDIVSWITVKGNHIPIRKGQSKEDAVKSFLEKKGDNTKSDNGMSKGHKRLGELNKKYGTQKGYLVQTKDPLTSKKEKILETNKKGQVSLTESGSGFHERVDEPKVDSVKAKNALRNEIKNTFFAEKARLYGYEGPDFVESENDGVLTLGVRDISGKSKIASVVKSLKNFWKFDVETETGEKGYTYFRFKGENK